MVWFYYGLLRMALHLSVLAVRVSFGLGWLLTAFVFGNVDAWRRGGAEAPHVTTWGSGIDSINEWLWSLRLACVLARRVRGGRGAEAPHPETTMGNCKVGNTAMQ